MRETADAGPALPLPEISYLPASLEADAARLEAQLAAVRRTRAKVGLITPALAQTADQQRPDDYLAFAETLRTTKYENYRDQQDAIQFAGAAAYLGLKAATTPQQQGRALALISRVMETQGLFRPAIESSAASVALNLDAAEEKRLATLRSQHGFRVLDYEIDSETTSPRLCVQFSEPLMGEAADLQRFVTLDGASDPTLTAEGQQLCVEGLTHGERYVVTVREGVPSTVGETLKKTAEFRAYVRDRLPLARFETNRYVLPAAAEGVPVTSVNSDELDLQLYRVNDRNIADVVRRDEFKRGLYPYELEDLAEERGALIWEGSVSIDNQPNVDVRTLIPLDDVITRTEPGVYVMTAIPVELANRTERQATQWFVVSDLGLSTFSAGGTVDVFTRSLHSAGALEGVEVALLARNDEVLATATTDAEGHAKLVSSAPTTGGQTPVLVTARSGDDYAFLSLAGGAFELTDRGVAGRAAPGPVDAFLATERGVYRGGETVHLTALVRDDAARALTLPVTVRLERPDGVVSRTLTARADSAGGVALDMPLTTNAATGTWTASAHIDPKGPSVGQTTFLVEDYVPQRIEVDISSDATEAVAGETIAATLQADFLYGAPAADLIVEGSLIVRPASGLGGFDGYRFGLAQEPFTPTRTPLFDLPRTGADGAAALTVPVPQMDDVSAALEARVVVSVREPGGRQVSDALTIPVATDRPLIGIKPKFDDDRVGEGSQAGFELIALSAARERIPARAEWTLHPHPPELPVVPPRWALVLRQRREARRRSRAVRWTSATTSPPPCPPPSTGAATGSKSSTPPIRASRPPLAFSAGWVSDSASADTPDILEVHLDKESYSPGDTATLKIVPRHAGQALITVLSGGVRHHQIIDVPAGGVDVPLTVEDDWAPGAYVAATLFRPVESGAGAQPLPQRSVGIAHMAVGTAEHRLSVKIDAPASTHPRQTLDVPVTVTGLGAGETAYVTLAAVDVGILNITGYQPPEPAEHYLGQRRLAVELRDLYGDLIDASGAMRGRVRSGGDGPGSGGEALPLAEEPVSLFTGILEAGPDGTATASLELPSFNGTLKLMAIVWSADKVGNASADMIVRDPVVMAGTLPRFLAPGDTTRMRLDLHNVANSAGEYRLAVMAGGPVALDGANDTFTLDEGERTAIEVAVAATGVGEAGIIAQLDGPDGLSITKDYVLTVRPAAAEVRERRVSVLNPGESLTLDAALLRPYDTDAEVTLSVGNGDLDTAGLLRMLDRFPYGCAEQTVSRALPLLYVNRVAAAIGIDPDTQLPEKIRGAVTRVLANQSSAGGFGLWSPGYDLWLTSYVMDFLTRAREAGYDVPSIAFQSGLDRLQSVLSYVGEIEGERGTDIAYATYVLARNGRAAIGDVRYFAEERLDDFPAPLARAQLAASLALSGDDALAERLFATAVPANLSEPRVYRSDYGTPVRDAAAIVALAAEVSGRRTRAGLAGGTARRDPDGARPLLLYAGGRVAPPQRQRADRGRTPDRHRRRRHGRAVQPRPHPGRAGGRPRPRQCRADPHRCRDHGHRLAAGAAAAGFRGAEGGAHLPHPGRRSDRYLQRAAEHAPGGDGDVLQNGGGRHAGHADGPPAGRVRDREPAPGGRQRHRRDPDGTVRPVARAHRVPRRPLRGSVGSLARQRQRADHRVLHGSRGDAGDVHAAHQRSERDVPAELPRPLRGWCRLRGADPLSGPAPSTAGRARPNPRRPARSAPAATGRAASARLVVPSRLWVAGFAATAFVIALGALALPALDRAFPPQITRATPSTVVLDRHGTLLRAFTDSGGRWRLPVSPAEVDPRFLDILLAYEDQRFREHAGVDPRAILRAAGQAATSGRIVSGASTLTMQTVRLMTDARRRTPWRKLSEAVRALQIERRLGKDEILAIYLNQAPYGGNIEGVRAASLAYFGREPARLTLAQAALLVALPQSPEARRPDRHPEAAEAARGRVLDRLETRGVISARDAAEAKREPVPTRRRPVPRLAPHLARDLVVGAPALSVHRTTLDAEWQARLEALAGERVDLIGPNVSAAILVADVATGEIRASVGSARFLDERRAGHVDMVRAVRSPGSTLKPFIYGMAMEAGLIAAGTLLRDTPSTFGGYEPDNFDDTFHGLVTASEALRRSLNVPAVMLLDALGAVRLAVRLQEAGALVSLPPTHTASLAIGLGGFGTRLVDLASLYTALAREGHPLPLYAHGAPPPVPHRLLERRAAAAIDAILAAMKPPHNARAGLIAYKTGTSYGYRDAWAVGYDARHVVAVWIGRPDGTPVAGLTGWTDAAPLLFDAFARIGITPRPPRPQQTPTADLPPPLQRFLSRGPDGAETDDLAIAFPPADATIALGGPEGARFPLTARVLGQRVDAWLLDGRPVDVRPGRRTAQIEVPAGAHTLTVVTADGASERVSFRVE